MGFNQGWKMQAHRCTCTMGIYCSRPLSSVTFCFPLQRLTNLIQARVHTTASVIYITKSTNQLAILEGHEPAFLIWSRHFCWCTCGSSMNYQCDPQCFAESLLTPRSQNFHLLILTFHPMHLLGHWVQSNMCMISLSVSFSNDA